MKSAQNGFTLIELIVVIVLLGIMAAGAGMLIARPIESYNDQLRRQQLVDQAEMALRRIATDIRRALPNSIRLVDNSPNDWALEMVETVDGARYRDEIGGAYNNQNALLTFNADDTDFNVLGRFTNLTVPGNYADYRVVIYNTNPADIYAQAFSNPNPGIVSPAGITLTDTGEHHVNMSAFQFQYQSPTQRLFIVDEPLSYTCDTATGLLNRFDSYGYTVAQIATAGAFPVSANSGLVATDVSACSISYQPGSSQRGGLVTLQLTLTDSENESVSLLHQVHVDNVP